MTAAWRSTCLSVYPHLQSKSHARLTASVVMFSLCQPAALTFICYSVAQHFDSSAAYMYVPASGTYFVATGRDSMSVLLSMRHWDHYTVIVVWWILMVRRPYAGLQSRPWWHCSPQSLHAQLRKYAVPVSSLVPVGSFVSCVWLYVQPVACWALVWCFHVGSSCGLFHVRSSCGL
jgi:hypothetical protein